MRNQLLKPIGKGMFTQAFLNEKTGKAVLHSVCPIKEAFSEWGVEHRLFPDIDCVDFFWRGDDYVKVYEMKYFPKKRSIKKNITARQYELYKALRKIGCSVNDNRYGDAMREAFSSLPSKFKQEKEALLSALDIIINYTDYPCFEISPRNIAIQGGKLILLDCFFCRHALAKARS